MTGMTEARAVFSVTAALAGGRSAITTSRRRAQIAPVRPSVAFLVNGCLSTSTTLFVSHYTAVVYILGVMFDTTPGTFTPARDSRVHPPHCKLWGVRGGRAPQSRDGVALARPPFKVRRTGVSGRHKTTAWSRS